MQNDSLSYLSSLTNLQELKLDNCIHLSEGAMVHLLGLVRHLSSSNPHLVAHSGPFNAILFVD